VTFFSAVHCMSAFSAVNSYFNAVNAEIRRGPQRKALRGDKPS
jgi:hypothetical protein